MRHALPLPHVFEQREWCDLRDEQRVGSERQTAGGQLNGEWRTFEVLLLSTGEPDRLSVVLRDVTERSTAHALEVKAAVELASAEETLDANVVHQAEAALREAQAQLEEAFVALHHNCATHMKSA